MTRNLIGGALMLVCVAPVANVAPGAALLLCGIALGLLAGGVDRG
jgi:ABC-type antimicrobial peptide transport system permease subunit